MNPIKKYQMRRYKRLLQRLDAEDEGRWVTTKNGRKIHISDEGTVDGGSPFALAVMGKPDKAMPTSAVELKESGGVTIPSDPNIRTQLAETLSSRQDKNCVFGGYYAVEDSGGTFTSRTFFNPYTGHSFSWKISDDEDARVAEDPISAELSKVSMNKDAMWVYKRSKGIVQSGDHVRVAKGRTIPIGTEAKVKYIKTLTFGGGATKTDYAYLDNGQKIAVSNLTIVDSTLDKGATAKAATKAATKATAASTYSTKKAESFAGFLDTMHSSHPSKSKFDKTAGRIVTQKGHTELNAKYFDEIKAAGANEAKLVAICKKALNDKGLWAEEFENVVNNAMTELRGVLPTSELKKTIGRAKTEKTIEAALKKTGIPFKNTSEEHGCPNFELADQRRIYYSKRNGVVIQDMKLTTFRYSGAPTYTDNPSVF